MRIVHVEDFFHPDAGYQVNILSKYMVKQGHEVIVVTSEMEKIPETLTSFFGKENIEHSDNNYTYQTGVKIIRLPLKRFVSGRAFFDQNLEITINNLNPELLYVHGNDTLTGMKFISNSEKFKFPIITDSHMLEMASQNPLSSLFRLFYKIFITPKIKKNRIKVIRTQDDNYVERCLGIPLELCPLISHGSDTILFHPNEDVKLKFRQDNDISSEDFVVIYAGKLSESKGAKLLAEAFLQKFENSRNRNIVLVVVGNTSGKYGQEVEDIFKRSSNRILRFPTQSYLNLAQFYQAADLSVFPKECSLSFFDVQACGLPVISEDNNINEDRLKYDNGFTFKAHDIENFRDEIIHCVEMDPIQLKRMGDNAYRYVKANYDYEYIAKQYIEILIKQYDKFHSR